MDNLKALLANWQPTAASMVTAFFGFVMLYPKWFTSVPWLVDVAGYAALGGLVAFGITAKQHNVTGGTVTLPAKEVEKK